MTLSLYPLILLLVGLFVFLASSGKASSLGLVGFAVGLYLLLATMGGPSVHLGG